VTSVDGASNQALKPGATFSKLLWKIFERFIFLGKDAHFRNFFGKIFGIIWKICRKALTLSYKRKLRSA